MPFALMCSIDSTYIFFMTNVFIVVASLGGVTNGLKSSSACSLSPVFFPDLSRPFPLHFL